MVNILCRYALFSILLILTTSSTSIRKENSLVKWLSIEEAIVKNKSDKRPFLIDVYTDWCGWCKVMDKNTFQDREVADLLNRYFHPVKLNGEHKEVIKVDGTTYSFVNSGRNGYHELAAILLNKELSYPTVVFLNDHLQVITRVQGYQKPKDFLKIVEYIGSNAYQTVPFNEFLSQQKKP
jgi:thioredoxin-related protein